MIKTIEVGFPGGKRVDAIIDDRLIQTDQRAENGGEGSAPEPFELFLASIATCAGIFAHRSLSDLGAIYCGKAILARFPDPFRYVAMAMHLK